MTFIGEFVTWIVSLFLDLITVIITGIFSVFGDINLPAFDTFSSFLTQFWDLLFSCIGYARSALLIDQFEWNLLLTIISLKLLYKPTIALIKMFVRWYDKLKL